MRVAAFHAGRLLGEVELEPVLTTCTWCGSGDLLSVHTVQADPLVELRRCRSCSAAGVSRLPTPAALDRYYDTYYLGDGAHAAHAVTTDDPDRLARRIASYAPDRDRLSILDLGGGDGTISAAVMARAGAKGPITVVDYDHQRHAAVPPGVSITQVADLDEIAAGARFDLVVASAVLEHLPRPAPVVAELLGRVAPGGTFYARTPYVEPWLALAGRLRTRIDFTFPAHLYDLGPRFWAGMPEWADGIERFTVVASRPSPVETGLRQRPLRTIVATAAKAPWHLVRGWPFVGGWEHALRARA